MGWTRATSAAIVLLWAGIAAAQTSGHPPVEAFGQLPDLSSPRLSPDGKHMAVLQNIDGRPVLCIYTVSAAEGSIPAILKSGDWIIGDIRWAKNDRLIFYMTKNAKLGWGYERAGHLTSWGRAVSVDLSARDPQVLFRHDVEFENNGGISEPADIDLDDPDNIYVPFYRYSNNLSDEQEAIQSSLGKDLNDMYRYDLFKVNVRTGDDTRVEVGDYGTREWFMDGHGHTIGRADRDSSSLETHLKLLDKGEWRDGGYGGGILGLSDDGTALVRDTYSKDSDTDELKRLDIATGKETALIKMPNFDIDGGLVDEWTGRIVGASYIDTRYRVSSISIPEREALQRGIEAAFSRTFRRSCLDGCCPQACHR